MEPLSKLQTFLETIMIEGEYNNFEEITGDVLKHIVNKLPEFDEFKESGPNQPNTNQAHPNELIAKGL